MRKPRVFLESLGCSKNTVDSETMLAMLRARGYGRAASPEEASLILVNTCAFIDEAREEAVNTILELAARKSPGSRLVVAGCLPQTNHADIIEGIPEVDAVIGVGNLEYIIDAAREGRVRSANAAGRGSPMRDGGRDFPESRTIGPRYREYRWGRELITPKGSAYLKIADGCGRRCTFCLIPRIRGTQRSREPEAVVEEARAMEDKGVRELVVISQDSLSYGKDLGMKRGLATLLEALVSGTRSARFRLLYLRPGRELLESLDIFALERVLPYFDIPIQHAAPTVLKKMGRTGGYETYAGIVERIRRRFPGAVLRTTVMTGFPGEGRAEFSLLMKFLEEARFDHLGVFRFSPQEGTKAASLEGRAAARTAIRRRETLLLRQREISRERLRLNVGRCFEVLIEERLDGGTSYAGRSYHFAPEVDGLFFVESKRALKPGDVVNAVVTGSGDYDLYGREAS